MPFRLQVVWSVELSNGSVSSGFAVKLEEGFDLMIPKNSRTFCPLE